MTWARVASGLDSVWSRMAARFPGEERAWAVKAVASNFPGPVGRGSEMVRVLNFTPWGGGLRRSVSIIRRLRLA
jgi:hypothetical protein